MKAYYVYYNGTREAFFFYSGMDAARFVSVEIGKGANPDLFVITSNPRYTPNPPTQLPFTK